VSSGGFLVPKEVGKGYRDPLQGVIEERVGLPLADASGTGGDVA
jgi:hypothetical protein